MCSVRQDSRLDRDRLSNGGDGQDAQALQTQVLSLGGRLESLAADDSQRSQGDRLSLGREWSSALRRCSRTSRITSLSPRMSANRSGRDIYNSRRSRVSFMSPVRLYRLPAVLAPAAAVALSRPSVAFGADDGQIALRVDGRPIPVAPEVIASNKAGVTVRVTRISTPLVIDGQPARTCARTTISPSSSTRFTTGGMASSSMSRRSAGCGTA